MGRWSRACIHTLQVGNARRTDVRERSAEHHLCALPSGTVEERKREQGGGGERPQRTPGVSMYALTSTTFVRCARRWTAASRLAPLFEGR